jgi:hypothetical protein
MPRNLKEKFYVHELGFNGDGNIRVSGRPDRLSRQSLFISDYHRFADLPLVTLVLFFLGIPIQRKVRIEK